MWTANMWVPLDINSSDNEKMYYPGWTVEPQKVKLAKFLNLDYDNPENLHEEVEYDENGNNIYNDDVDHSDGFSIEFQFARLVTIYMWQVFLPSLLLCIASTLSAFIPSHIVPGRMSLSVTSFLALVALFGNARSVHT